MYQHVLVAVDDSAPALAAAAAGIEVARQLEATLTFVTVTETGHRNSPILAYVEKLAAAARITATTITCEEGPAFEAILAEAHRHRADLIVMGRSDKQRRGTPHVGSQTAHLLEFTDIPVLIVPTPPRH